jgi:hypothetical protein
LRIAHLKDRRGKLASLVAVGLLVVRFAESSLSEAKCDDVL